MSGEAILNISPLLMSCPDCNTVFSISKWSYECPKDKNGCGKMFCSKCTDFSLADKGLKCYTNYCKTCFKRCSSLDFDQQVTIFGPEKGNSLSLLFVHGGGGNRNMFLLHAQELSKLGYRCVLIDLPGHGSRMDVQLSLDSSIEIIREEATKYCAAFNGTNPVYIGSSLGGYIGMEMLGRYPDLFSAAIITMCGQDVGTQRSMLASAGLFAMKNTLNLIGATTALKVMISQAIGNGNIDKSVIFDIAGGSGMYFHQGTQQIQILKESNPRDSLPKFKGRILFINGSRDHRDSEQIWLQHSKNSKLITYENGDHFFSHDNRFISKFITDMNSFCQEIIQ